jgi:hypothetical protein
MDHTILVHFPRQDWAHSAMEDLRREGCDAQLLPGPGLDGTWCLRVSGSAAQIHEIRQSMQPIQPVCWETFVNDAIAS